MTANSRLEVARRLAPLGLKRTLIVVPGKDGCRVSQIRAIGDNVDLKEHGRFDTVDLPVIGRVGVRDQQLGDAYPSTMPFYGKWFDDIGETDAGYHIRRGIASLSEARLLEQIQRDDQYALVADFASAFRTIMQAKQRPPLVLIDDRYLALDSFPVVLPTIPDAGVAGKLMAVLAVMLKAESQQQAPDASGIEVDES